MSLRCWDRNSLYISRASKVWYKCNRMRKGNETACVLCELSELRQLGGCWGRVKLQRRGSQPAPERWKARWVIPAQLHKQESDKIWIFEYKWEFRDSSASWDICRIHIFPMGMAAADATRWLFRWSCSAVSAVLSRCHMTRQTWNNVSLSALLLTALIRPLLSCWVTSLG